MRTLTVARSFAVDLAGYLDERGLDGAAIARSAGIDVTTVEGRVPGRDMAEFWRQAMIATADPDLGLRAATASGTGALDIVGYVMLSSSCAGEALRRGAWLIRLLNDGVDLHLTDGAEETEATLIVRGDGRDPLWLAARQVHETIMAGLVHQLRRLTGRAVVPRAVSFMHPQPAHGTRTHAQVFGVLPRFDAPTTSVVVAASDLGTPLRSANATLHSAFSALADAAIGSLGESATITARTSAELRARLRGEVPPLAAVASALALSTRSLNRALAAEGTSYQIVLDDVRREMSTRLLSDERNTVAKLAWLLGFQ